MSVDNECKDFLPWLERKAGVEISSLLSIGKSTHGRQVNYFGFFSCCSFLVYIRKIKWYSNLVGVWWLPRRLGKGSLFWKFLSVWCLHYFCFLLCCCCFNVTCMLCSWLSFSCFQQISEDNMMSEIQSLLGDEVGNVSKLALLLLIEQRKGQVYT